MLMPNTPMRFLHLTRHAIVANYQPLVVQSAGFALHDETPKRVAGFADKPVACAGCRAARGAFMRGERG